MSETFFSPTMMRAIKAEAWFASIIEQESLAQSEVRQQYEQVMERQKSTMTPTEQAQITALHDRVLYGFYRRRGQLGSLEAHNFMAEMQQRQRNDESHPAINSERVAEFMLRIDLDFVLYDGDYEPWTPQENANDAELLTLPSANVVSNRIGAVMLHYPGAIS